MIVAIDGASTDLSVALVEADGSLVDEASWSSAQRQSSELLPRLLGLLRRGDLSLAEADAFAVGTGPGSFTGLRVAMALAKGFAFALGKPIVGVPSLAAWLDEDPEAIAAIARAGAREAYVLLRGEEAPLLADRDRLAERIGDRLVVAPGELADAFDLASTSPPRAAAAIGRRAAARLADEPVGDDLRRLEPTYLRAPRGVAAAGRETIRWL